MILNQDQKHITKIVGQSNISLFVSVLWIITIYLFAENIFLKSLQNPNLIIKAFNFN